MTTRWLTHLPQQRNLNNAFAYDLVPSPSVITAALRAARRVNDFPTAVRIFEGMQYSFLCNRPCGSSWICRNSCFSGENIVANNATGIKFKVENPQQYEDYLRELEPVRQELGISLKEWMYPDNK
jgi:cytochrome c oxidase subunit 5a